MRMHAMIIASAIAVSTPIFGCASPSSDDQSARMDSYNQNHMENPSLLSAKGELFPLSTYFGVCMRNVDALRSKLDNGMLSPHFPSYAEITGSGGVMKISVGKFGMLPGTVFKDVPASAKPRHIKIGRDRSGSFVLVSDFGAGSNLVSISYDESDTAARTEAIRIANNVVPCHLSIGPASPERP